MGNLFIVYTPFQLFVAQQIVRQENLQNNILIEGSYVKDYNFFNIFDMMEIDGYWKKKILFHDIAAWDGLKISSFKDAKKAYRNYKKIKGIIKENDVDKIYLGEHQNQAMRFTDVVFSKQGYDICFFEEGTAHYIEGKFVPDRSYKTAIKIFLRDLFYYIPLYHVRFAKWRYNVNMPYDNLPIHKRYNILPYHHKPYDVHLNISLLVSEKLKRYMEQEIEDDKERRVMLMTDPMAELITHRNMHLYYDVIKEYFHSIPHSTTVYIKYHPREPIYSREKTESIIKGLGLSYKILSKDVNISVEYFLQKYKFDMVYIFNASTYFYNGYVFPECKFIKMLPALYKKCIDNNVNDIDNLKSLVDAMGMKDSSIP